MTASVQRNATTAPAFCIAIVQDISERKRLQEELQRSKTRLELAVRGSNVRIWDIEVPDGNIDNAGVYARGYFLKFSTFLSRVHPDDLEGLRARCSVRPVW